MKLNTRNLGPELMDDPSLNLDDLEKVLVGLNKLNFLSNTNINLFQIVRSIIPDKGRPIRILDLGSGGGEVFSGLVKLLRQDGYDIQATGTDINTYAVSRANKYAKSKSLDVTFLNYDAIKALEEFEFDLVTSVLFLHHMKEEVVISILQLIQQKAHLGLAMIDLERSMLNYYLVNLATSLVSNSKILKEDGLQSVRSAFTIIEFEKLAKGLLSGIEVKKKFPCRMSIEWRRDASAISHITKTTV